MNVDKSATVPSKLSGKRVAGRSKSGRIYKKKNKGKWPYFVEVRMESSLAIVIFGNFLFLLFLCFSVLAVLIYTLAISFK